MGSGPPGVCSRPCRAPVGADAALLGALETYARLLLLLQLSHAARDVRVNLLPQALHVPHGLVH